MTFELFMQAFIAPVLVAIVAGFVKRWYPVVIAIGFWGISLWVKGLTLEAMDSIAMVVTLSAVLILLSGSLSKRWLALAQWFTLAALSTWQVKNFALDLPLLSWIIQAVLLTGVVAFSWLVPAGESTAPKAWSRFDTRQLYWLIPVGYLAIVSPLAGSILIGQMAGLIAVFALAVWIFHASRHSDEQQLALFVAAPALFVGQMAWHYAEIPWTSLLVGLVGWVPLLMTSMRKRAAWFHLLIATVLFAGLTSLGLWLEWPEQSLY
ncbi:hypothetical protein [Reinekea sp. G2M2-21]|uniref:hypothetical protein n=1 Tax=Reinekea sp. G2M2-21 TaxID=2788942 RepID=UPI0018AB68BE|nr:hypothetical protein [Reinekea sp. G2M2-21]